MPIPVFEEYEPAGDCACQGCAERRRAPAIALRDGGHPAAHGARRVLVLATAAGVVLGGGGGAGIGIGGAGTAAALTPDAVPAAPRTDPPRTDPPQAEDPPGSPQGKRSPLHGRPGRPGPQAGAAGAAKRIDRATIINRAKLWLDAEVPYSMEKYWTDGYRQDCSGYVSMAWNLGTNEWTGSLDKFATKITKDELLPGDMLLFHNPADPNKGSHVVIFGGWVDDTRTHYIAYEQTKPNTRKLATPYGYWKNSAKYLPYRFTGVTGGVEPQPQPQPQPTPQPQPQPPTGPAAQGSISQTFPGAAKFGPGADNEYVAQLGRMLIDRGGRRFYPKGASTKWSDADRLATQAFQEAQGWTGADADGIPGEHTWRLLVQKQGKDITPIRTGTPPQATPNGARPATGNGARPVAGAAARPVKGNGVRPATGAAARPVKGTGARPTTGGAAARPATGNGVRPATGNGVRPATGAGARPVTGAGHRIPAFPGAGVFRPGSSHPSIEALGRQLRKKGFGTHYTSGPGARWTEADRRNVEAFQRAQGWRGASADGYPGPETWRRLFA
ncbi:peptidoglycan-binding protein [Streptomyces sp. NPDC090022]|uniref:peptidoglycan-binding protein n=1 Tax=Streptomyces sp. NPDC090022 TaxID=3365920 RepID=UPI00382CA030